MKSNIDLPELARLTMISHGLEPDFPDSALLELEGISKSATAKDEQLPDLTRLPWCSIDNDDSRDLDQYLDTARSLLTDSDLV